MARSRETDAKVVYFEVEAEDHAELRLVAYYGGGSRSEFLGEALRVMTAREHAERGDPVELKETFRLRTP